MNETTYEIMHTERVVASVTSVGVAEICDARFMPYDLYFEAETDIDTRLNNLDVFYHWCATRVLTLDRVFAKEILNSIGEAQAVTDRDRAKIALSYHCVSLTDVYWVRKRGEDVSFAELNLYDHTLNRALVDLPLRGRQMTVTNRELAQDLSTGGCFPKAWIRTEDGFFLLKDGGADAVGRELLASELAGCFDFRQVKYTTDEYDGQPVTKSKLVSSKRYSLVSRAAFEIYAENHDLNATEECKRLDPETYFGMNIIDYLVGNTDRHRENWGLSVDNTTNLPLSLYPLMDFNRSFLEYDRLDGGICLTTDRRMTQREAALEAVKAVGLRMLREPDMSRFGEHKAEAEMFRCRLAELQKYDV